MASAFCFAVVDNDPDQKFKHVEILLTNPKCTVHVFSTGKLKVTNASTLQEARNALGYVAYTLKNKLNIEPAGFYNFKTNTIFSQYYGLHGIPLNLDVCIFLVVLFFSK